MKVMSCIDCGEGSFSASSSDDMMKVMMPHYGQFHADIMSGKSSESRDDWMKRFLAAWDVASSSE